MSENKNAFGNNPEPVTKTPEADKVITAEIVKPVTLDGQPLPAGMTVKISVKQHRALARHFAWIDGPKEHKPREKSLLKQVAEEATKPAALIALLFVLLFLSARNAHAAPPTTWGDIILTNGYPFIPTNGPDAAHTNSFGYPTNIGVASGFTNSWVKQTNANINGTVLGTYGKAFNVINVTKWDQMLVTWTANTQSGTSGFTNTLTLASYDPVLDVVDTNHPVALLTLGVPTGANAVLITNIPGTVLGSTGYVVPLFVSSTTGAGSSTNHIWHVSVKPIRAGT